VQAAWVLGRALARRDPSALPDASAPAFARVLELAVAPSSIRGEDAATFGVLGVWADVLGLVAREAHADRAVARALADRRVAEGFRARLSEFREIDLSRPSEMIDALGRRTTLRLAIEFLDDSFPRGGAMSELRPISERLTSLAVAHHATVEELAALERRYFGGEA
jgi:hypothetical protein